MSPAGTSKDLGAAIRAERKRQNLAQTGLANLCAVSRPLISNLENDRTVIPGSTFSPVCNLTRSCSLFVTILAGAQKRGACYSGGGFIRSSNDPKEPP